MDDGDYVYRIHGIEFNFDDILKFVGFFSDFEGEDYCICVHSDPSGDDWWVWFAEAPKGTVQVPKDGYKCISSAENTSLVTCTCEYLKSLHKVIPRSYTSVPYFDAALIEHYTKKEATLV